MQPRTHARTTKPELLAPAGGPEPFAAALAAGADAIYCGMGAFNARRKATNFTDEAFAAACRKAHVAGARVYVTVNIVIKQTEMPAALELVRRCTMLGADAFIIQDWGLFFKIRELMPSVETHISTQANIHDARGTAWCRDAGADRVTLSRELSTAEIAQISREVPEVDLEVFSHGAICFCYSGLCLLSSFAMAGRSANRGMCAQPCRLPYELIDENGRNIAPEDRGRPLCPRDTNTSEMLERMIEAGANALKLEGRMKAPDYVYSVVDAYRRELDDVLASRVPEAGERAARQRQLKRCFNRDFTHAYQDGTSGDEMMSYERSNNRGQIVGTTLKSKPSGIDTRGLARDDRRRRAAIACIELSEPVGAGDLLELRHPNDPDKFLTCLAPDDAAAGGVIECKVPRAMPAGCVVRVIRSQAAIDCAGAALKREVARKRAVNVRVTARLGELFRVELSCADDPALTAQASGFTVEPARTRPVTREDLIEHVGRMGSSPFEAAGFEVEMDEGCGMGFSAVHKVRAAACKALEEAILAPHAALAREVEQVEIPQGNVSLGSGARLTGALAGEACDREYNGTLCPREEVKADEAATNEGCGTGRDGAAPRSHAEARATEATANATCGTGHGTAAPCSHAGVSTTERNASTHAPAGSEQPCLCALVQTLAAAEAARKAGAERIYMPVDALVAADLSPAGARERGIVPVLDEVCREADHERLDPWIGAGAPAAVGNISELALASERRASAEIRSCFPVHNLACMQALAARGAAGFWLSPELTLDEIEHIGPDAPAPLGICVLGRPRVMTSEHCILQVADACIHDCARCRLRQRELALRNIDGKVFPVRTSVHGRSHLYAAAPVDITPQMGQLLAAGVTRFLVDGTLMDEAELSRSVTRAKRALEAARTGRKPAPRQKGTTSGCLFAGIE